MLSPQNFHAGWDSKEFHNEREVTAHNMACQAMWVVHRRQSELEELLQEMPDHFCRRGKKTEYSLMITKDKKGHWQILYANLNPPLTIDCYSDDKNYPLLDDAIRNCKKYLPTRNRKK